MKFELVPFKLGFRLQLSFAKLAGPPFVAVFTVFVFVESFSCREDELAFVAIERLRFFVDASNVVDEREAVAERNVAVLADEFLLEVLALVMGTQITLVGEFFEALRTFKSLIMNSLHVDLKSKRAWKGLVTLGAVVAATIGLFFYLGSFAVRV